MRGEAGIMAEMSGNQGANDKGGKGTEGECWEDVVIRRKYTRGVVGVDR